MPFATSTGGLIATGLAEGLKQGLSTYQQRMQYNEDKKRQDALVSLKAKEQGLIYNPDDGTYSETPEYRSLKTEKEKQQKIDLFGKLPEDMRNTAFGQKLIKDVYGGESWDENPYGQQPQGLIQGQQPQNQFGLLPGAKTKEQRKMDEAVNTAVAIEKAKNAIGKDLPAGEASKLGGANASFKKLDDLENTVNANSGTFGPIAGRLSNNPYNTTAKGIKAQTLAAVQDIGTYLENGKLTDRDIPKYERMLPAITDTPEVAKEKLSLIRKLIQDKQGSEKEALGGAGYRVGGIKTGDKRSGEKSLLLKGKDVAAQPVSQANAHPQDSVAVQWAKSNPKDPRSAAILKANGL